MNKKLQTMIEDYDHWHGRKPPLCPNDYEVNLYQGINWGFTACLFIR
jgi:hypothetical protein